MRETTVQWHGPLSRPSVWEPVDRQTLRQTLWQQVAHKQRDTVISQRGRSTVVPGIVLPHEDPSAGTPFDRLLSDLAAVHHREVAMLKRQIATLRANLGEDAIPTFEVPTPRTPTSESMLPLPPAAMSRALSEKVPRSGGLSPPRSPLLRPHPESPRQRAPPSPWKKEKGPLFKAEEGQLVLALQDEVRKRATVRADEDGHQEEEEEDESLGPYCDFQASTNRLASSAAAAVDRARSAQGGVESQEVHLEKDEDNNSLAASQKPVLQLRGHWLADSAEQDLSLFNSVANNVKKSICADENVFSFDDTVESVAVPATTRVLDPTERTCLCWNFLGVVAVIYEAIMLPLQLFSLPEATLTDVINFLTAVYWTLDLPMSFCKAYYKGGKLVQDFGKVAKAYLLSWFLPDLGVVVVDWISLFVDGTRGLDDLKRTSRALRCVRFVRFIRLLRMMNATKFFAELRTFSNAAFQSQVNVLTLIFALALLTHYIACLWFAVSHNSWVPALPVDTLEIRYLMCLHWSLCQLGVGSSNLGPQTANEFLFAIAFLFLGICIYSSMVSIMANAVEQIRTRRQADRAHFTLYHRFCNQHSLSTNLKCRMQAYIEHVYYSRQRHLCIQDVTLLNFLSGPLLQELQLQIWMPYLQAQPMLARLSRKFHSVMQVLCSMAIDASHLAAHDEVFQAGQLAERMYFVVGGELRYTRAHVGSREYLIQGMWASEAAIWIDHWVTLGQLRSTMVSELLVLKCEEFSTLMNLHPPALDMVKKYAAGFLEWVNESEEEDISDVMGGPNIEGSVTEIFRSTATEENNTRKTLCGRLRCTKLPFPFRFAQECREPTEG